MVSDFRRKKYMEVFQTFFDADKSGSLTKDDFSAAMVKLAQLRGYEAGSVTYNLMKEMVTVIWDGLVQVADKDGDGVVNAEEWVTLWDSYAQNPATVAEWQEVLCKCIFQLLDATNDGSIDANEFADVLSTLGEKKEDAVTAFAKMSGGKASVSEAEFNQLFNEFFSTDDVTAPGNFVFGLLD